MGMLAQLAQQSMTTKPMAKSELPEGTYTVVVDLAKENYTQKGKQTIHWSLIIAEGDFTNRKLFKDSYVTIDSLPWLMHDLQCAGWTKDTGELEKAGRNRFNPDNGLNETIYPPLMGKMMRVQVKYKMKDGMKSKYPDVIFKESAPTNEIKTASDEIPWE